MNYDTMNVPGELISWFDDLGTGNHDYNFLSNFYVGEPLTIPGVTWEAMAPGHRSGLVEFATGEAAFAALKTRNATQFIAIAEAQNPQTAKSYGRHCDLREDWEVVKLDVMMAVTRAKYTLDREEGKRLMDTGAALLIEGTMWGDDVWGVDFEVHASTSWGANWLGTMLMARRAELLAETYFGVGTRAGERNAKTAVDGWQKPAWM